MTNMRAGIKFYFFTNGTTYPVQVAESAQVVEFNDIDEPLRARVTATGDPNILNISWSSNWSAVPVVRWGTFPRIYHHISFANTERILRTDMCGVPASTIEWRDLGAVYTASLEGLAILGGCYVYYVFGDSATNSWNKERKLRVPPLPGQQPPDRPTTAIQFDDLGRGALDMAYTWNEYGRPSIYTAMAVGAEAEDGQIDAIYHGGDISYAKGSLAVWDFFMLSMQRILLYTARTYRVYDKGHDFSNGEQSRVPHHSWKP